MSNYVSEQVALITTGDIPKMREKCRCLALIKASGWGAEGQIFAEFLKYLNSKYFTFHTQCEQKYKWKKNI